MYEELTQEELIEKLTERDTLIATLKAETSGINSTDTEAEINSLKTELEELRKLNETQAEELKRTKELNFTLGRQVERGHRDIDIDEAIHGIFGKGE